MKHCLITFCILLVIFSGCSNRKTVLENTEKSDVIEKHSGISFWLDKETGTVHQMILKNGIRKVVSIMKYKDENLLEKMKILISENSERGIRWIYFVPSTKYVVDLTAHTFDDKEIHVDWANKSAEGEEKSGSDIFLKCNEKGRVF